MYEYKLDLDEVYDGDTIYGWVNFGCQIQQYKKIRLFGINAPEIRTRNKKIKLAGLAAKTYLAKRIEQALQINKPLVIKTERDKTGKYGRLLATVYIDGVNINEELVYKGYAKKKKY